MVRFSRVFVLLTAVAVSAGFSFSDDLDAALEAQKKKAQRRVYSGSALLHDQNLVVPREISAEEKAIDKELQVKEARQETAPFSPLQQPARLSAVTVRPAENQNWLTSALMDDKAAVTVPDKPENSWITQEMDRQKELKAQESAVKENELVEKLLREKTQPQSGLPGLDRLKQYQPALGKTRGADKNKDIPSYVITADPLAAVRPAAKKEKPVAPPLFSPEAARLSSLQGKEPLRTVKNPLFNLSPGASSRTTLHPVFSPEPDTPETPLLTPLEMIRKSSPINRPDPFADDHMPKIKSSIWE